MRRTYRKNNFREINKQIIIIGLAFMIFIVLGTYLNKIWIHNSEDILSSISPAIEYYKSDINLKNLLIPNLKADIGFMGLICLFTLFIVTFPLVIIIFMLKGLSIGYTINSFILALKFKSAKMVLIVMFKNIIIIPSAIILILISISYIKEIIYSLKKSDNENILFLIRRYLLNGLIISIISVTLQLLLNAVSINVIKFLVK